MVNRPDPDPLDVRNYHPPSWSLGYDSGHDVGYDAGFVDGVNVGRRIRPITASTCFVVGIIVGLIVGIVWNGVVRAAPRSAQAVIPSASFVDVPRIDGRFERTIDARRNLPGPTEAPIVLSDVVPETTPVSRATNDASFSGVASWYPAAGMIAAAGPRLRVGTWRGRVVDVNANGRHVRVRLVDWCQCYGTRLLDLSDDAFAQLAPLSRGLVKVKVTR